MSAVRVPIVRAHYVMPQITMQVELRMVRILTFTLSERQIQIRFERPAELTKHLVRRHFIEGALRMFQSGEGGENRFNRRRDIRTPRSGIARGPACLLNFSTRNGAWQVGQGLLMGRSHRANSHCG